MTTTPEPLFVVLFSNPSSRVRRLRYMRRVDICTNSPVAARSRSAAVAVRESTAREIVRNLRARAFDAACEPA